MFCVIGSVAYNSIVSDYSDYGNAMYNLWAKSGWLLLFLSNTVALSYVDSSSKFKDYVLYFAYVADVFMYLRTQWGYFVDTGYSYNAGLFFFILNATAIWGFGNYKLICLYRDFFPKKYI